MSTIQNLKNFIRHGKQARAPNPPHADPTTTVTPVHAQQQRYQHAAPQNQNPVTDPNVLDHNQLNAGKVPLENYSAANVDNRNVAAQAGGAAAKAAADKQDKIARQNDLDPSVIERIVTEERESRGQLPRYPGLERWTLLEKMGDGAFSNVYRAKDNTNQLGEVAIKVVRKFEMNNSQVSQSWQFATVISACQVAHVSIPSVSGQQDVCCIYRETFADSGLRIGREPFASGFQKEAKGRRGAH